MCLISIACRASARFPFVVAANRDELHARATLSAGWWDDYARILGGRDLVAGGGWLAVDRAGRLAAVTNVREQPKQAHDASRGWLVRDFLAGTVPAAAFASGAERDGARYGAFNLLLKDETGLYYASNRASGAPLGLGVHVLGNAPLGTAWPKMQAMRRGMLAALAEDDPAQALLELLARRDADGDAERYDAHARSLFIEGAEYGTRSSTVVVVSASGELRFTERSFDRAGKVVDEVHHRFRLEAPAAGNGTNGR